MTIVLINPPLYAEWYRNSTIKKLLGKVPQKYRNVNHINLSNHFIEYWMRLLGVSPQTTPMTDPSTAFVRTLSSSLSRARGVAKFGKGIEVTLAKYVQEYTQEIGKIAFRNMQSSSGVTDMKIFGRFFGGVNLPKGFHSLQQLAERSAIERFSNGNY